MNSPHGPHVVPIDSWDPCGLPIWVPFWRVGWVAGLQGEVQ